MKAKPGAKVVLLLSKPSLYFSVLESAKLLGGLRVDCQSFDDLGWWVRSVALEFVVPLELLERFEREIREIYVGSISIIIEREAALST